MPIRYFLLDNKMGPAKGKQRAQVASNGTRNMDDIFKEALHRGTGVTRTDMIAVTDIIHTVIMDFAVQGYTVITPVFQIRSGIRGSFDSPETSFNKAEHEVRPALSAGHTLKKKFKEAKVTKIKGGTNDPDPKRVYDQKSGSHNTEITPGGMASLHGHRLNFEESDPDEGVFLEDEAKNSIRVSAYLGIKSNEFNFSIPAGLAPGFYELSLRSRLGTKTLKEGSLRRRLEVK